MGDTKILFIDDEQAIADQAKKFLEKQNKEFEVDIYYSSVEALEEMEQEDYSCVISDYEMPEKDGLEVLNEVKNEKGDIPFIIFTGKGEEEVAMEALNSGANRYFKKGKDPKKQYEELARAVKEEIEYNNSHESSEKGSNFEWCDLEASEVLLFSSESDELNDSIIDVLNNLKEEYSNILYVTVSKPADSVKDKYNKNGIMEDVDFLDLTDSEDSSGEGDVQKISPEDLSGLSIEIKRNLKKKEDSCLIMDDVNSLTIYNDEDLVSRFIHSLMSQLRGMDTTSVFFLVKEETEEEFEARLKHFSDHYKENL